HRPTPDALATIAAAAVRFSPRRRPAGLRVARSITRSRSRSFTPATADVPLRRLAWATTAVRAQQLPFLTQQRFEKRHRIRGPVDHRLHHVRTAGPGIALDPQDDRRITGLLGLDHRGELARVNRVDP